MEKHKSFIDASKLDWGRSVEGSLTPNYEEIKIGCLQRIASSLEHIEMNSRNDKHELNKLIKQNQRLKDNIKLLKNMK